MDWIYKININSHDFSNDITTGLYLPDKQRLILGNDIGIVNIFKFNIKENDLTKINEFKFENRDSVRTITRFEDNSIILIGTLNAGNLRLLDIDKNLVLHDEVGDFDKYNRIFCSEWLNNEEFLIGSTYGNLNYYYFNEHLEVKNINGHGSDAIFGIGYLNDDMIISGGYNGGIKIWGYVENGLEIKSSLNGSRETIQAIASNRPGDYFATLGKEGTIQVFKKYIDEENSNEDWILFLKYISGSGIGKFLKFSKDNKKLFAITKNEIIILDIETTGIHRYPNPDCQYLFEREKEFLVIHKKGIFKIEIKEPETTLYQSFQYSKVGVIGHTQTGKSTICNAIIYDDFDPSIKSTEMRTVWDWELNNENPLKIILHDFGGQSSIIPAHLPHLIDSDLILIVYNQNSPITFEIAMHIREELIEDFGYKNNFIFIQTHSDERDRISRHIIKYNKENPEEKINPIITGLSEDNNKIEGVEDLKDKIYAEIRNLKPKRQIITNETESILKLVESLQESNIEEIKFDDFYNEINEILGNIKKKYLLYVLRSLGVQGRIELRKMKYIGTTLKKVGYFFIIYLNMRKIFESKNEILEEAQSNHGLIDWKMFLSDFDDSELEYLNIAIDMLESDNTCTVHHNQKLFLDFIKDTLDEYDKKLMENKNLVFSEDSILIKKTFPKDSFPKPDKWISLFLELNLTIESLSTTGAVFYYLENKAYCYISFNIPSDILNPNCIISAYIDGTSEEIKSKLQKDVINIFSELFELNGN